MAAFRTRFPRRLLIVVAGILFIANTINIGSDLSAMADAAEMLSGVSSHFWVFVFAGENRLRHRLPALSDNRQRAEMARSHIDRIRHHRFSCRTALG